MTQQTFPAHTGAEINCGQETVTNSPDGPEIGIESTDPTQNGQVFYCSDSDDLKLMIAIKKTQN
ncbi:hypothetical protein SBDP1_340002 [Syntrophobacter sp. SbD1]|nr:hypothetical protein SBDP1_340002 [Syntrophobacter sp. SbD1]